MSRLVRSWYEHPTGFSQSAGVGLCISWLLLLRRLSESECDGEYGFEQLYEDPESDPREEGKGLRDMRPRSGGRA